MKTSRRSVVDPFLVMDVMKAARAAEDDGRHIIHMEVGQPSTGAPSKARAALAGAMEEGPLGYTVALGLPELRKEIAALYKDWYGVDLDWQRVVITTGSSGAFILAFTALFDAGAKVGMGEPGYPSYRQILSAMNIEPVGIPTTLENRLQPVPSEIPDGIDGLIVASPGNPSGTMLGHEDMGALIKACHDKGIAYISDEIYHGIQYEGRAVTALELSDDVYVINSFSKFFSMTGWRIGWMVVPEDHVRVIERLAMNFFLCPPHASQVAALGALEARQECQEMVDVYAENRRLMLEELPKIGFDKIAPPDGAFYIYADVSAYTEDSKAFCDEILAEVGVAVTPGIDFDPKRGAQTLRFSYARSTEDIREGLSRLGAFMAERS